MKMRCAVACCLLAAVSTASAQQMRRPVLGWIFDSSSGQIRAIAGVAGAAIVDDVLPLDQRFRFAAVAPGGGLAIAESEDQVALVRWSTGAPSMLVLDEALRNIDRVIFSPTGKVAALRSGQYIQVWTALDDRPVKGTEMESDGEVVAISDSGAVAISRRSAVIVREAPGSEWTVYEGADVRSLAFRPLSGELAIADFASGEVLVSSNGLTRGIRTIERPMALAYSADGQTLNIAAEQSWAAVNLSSSDTRSIPCRCAANGMQRMRGNAIFRLGEGSKGVIQMIDADAGEPRLFVAPQIGGRQ